MAFLFQSGKLLLNNEPSTVCKHSLFKQFLVCRDFVTPVPDSPLFCKDLTYEQAKSEAKSYQMAKVELYNWLCQKGRGWWIGKPMEQDMFTID